MMIVTIVKLGLPDKISSGFKPKNKNLDSNQKMIPEPFLATSGVNAAPRP
jgi:hypothetical protein